MKALRDSGMKVFDCSAVGQGFPDLCASFRGGNYLLETKSHKNVSHRVAQPLTVAQIAFHNTWAGDIGIVETPEQAVAWVIAQAAREGRL
jgi:hypothetical protein